MSTDKNSATPDVDDELPEQTAKSAEDRKAAAAMAALDTRGDNDDASSAAVDHEAASKAMGRLGGAGGGAKDAPVVKKAAVKVDAADVALVMDQLELNKIKATELLKLHDGDAVRAMKAHIAVAF